MRQLQNMKYGKDCVTGEGGVLVAQQSMPGADAAKVKTNKKADTPNTSDASNSSNIDTSNIDMNRWIEKPCAVAITLIWHVTLRQHYIRDSQSGNEGSDTGNFDETIDAKEE